MPLKTKIFIIDDDPTITTLLTTKLRKQEHYNIITTNDPFKAEALAADEQPDIIVCDIDMDGMDGGDVSRALGANPFTKDIPILFLSSLVTREHVEKNNGIVGGRPMISKNKTSIADLINRVEKMLKR